MSGKQAKRKRREERLKTSAQGGVCEAPSRPSTQTPPEVGDRPLPVALGGGDSPPPSPALLKTSELAEMLKVSRMTLFRMEKKEGIPGRVKIGGRVRYHREIIEKWLLERAKG